MMFAGVKLLRESPGPLPPSMLVGPRELPAPLPPKPLLPENPPLGRGAKLAGGCEGVVELDAPDKSTVLPGWHEGAL